MNDQLTQCPHCLTSFRVTDNQLTVAEGLVRCGSCLGLFSASINFIRIKPVFDPETFVDDDDFPEDELLVDDDDVPLGNLDLDDDAELPADAFEDEIEEDDEDEPEDEYEDEDDADEEELPLAASYAPYEEYQEADLFAGLPEPAEDSKSTVDEEGDAFEEDEDEWVVDDTGDDEFNPHGGMDLDEEDALELEYSRTVLADAGEDHEEAFGSGDNDKTRVNAWLQALEDEEALEPLAAAHLAAVQEDPLTLDAGRKGRGIFATAALVLISLALLSTLGLQFVAHNLEQLDQRNSFARFKPFFCRILQCPVPAVVPLSSLYSQELLVRTHPRVPNALELSFIFRNDADLPQAFPGLELSFRSMDNALLANRLFRPEEYLPPELRMLDAMPARSSVQVQLELADPGSAAVNYTIAFREL